jgi:hypothetical protein
MVDGGSRHGDGGWVMVEFYGGWWTIHGDWLWWMGDGDGGWLMVTMLMGEIQYHLWAHATIDMGGVI